MLNSITTSHVFVLDQDQALDFYVGKLGLEKKNDFDLGFMRWLTVGVPGDSREILLEKPGPPAIDPAATEQIRELLTKGAMGFSVGFSTEDIQKTHETLTAQGVDITDEPTERFYGSDM
ncbi:MAG: VOC family protein, partial [Candidatus Dormibacteraeota bacterium]|nr:VOC family protein [Candidatus Dormibacteraeota bacterium]